jgi:uncharacterized protein
VSDDLDTPAHGRDPHLLFPIFELTRRIGTRRPFVATTQLTAPSVVGVAVPAGEPVAIDLVIESVLDGIMVTGTLVAPWSGECRRCLEPIHGTIDLEVRELFEARHTPGDSYPIDGDHIDLNPLVHDVVLLGLPLLPLCRPDCPGPDPERFPTTVEADPVAETPVADAAPGAAAPDAATARRSGDPRWAALDALRLEE